MGSRDGAEVMGSGCHEAKCSEATVEIKIKTLDSQTYTLRVDKCVPVPTLKEEIATMTGVEKEQQRLICRGRVLKDNELLSAYQVEDGHTLHLVVGRPAPPSENLSDPATEPASSNDFSQPAPRVVIGTIFSDQSDASHESRSQTISAVLSSFMMVNIERIGERLDHVESALEGLSTTNSSSNLRDFRRLQSEQVAAGSESNSRRSTSLPLPSSVPPEFLQPPVLPDSLTTLMQYLSRLREQFSSSVGSQRNVAGSAGQNRPPSPESLSVVMQSTGRLLVEQVAEQLSQLIRQIDDQENVTALSERMRIQTDASRSGELLHEVGALLLELGRTVRTLQLGQTAADAVVNAGPALYISSSGPNPITAQPRPVQRGRSFVAVPIRNAQSGSLDSSVLTGNTNLRTQTEGRLQDDQLISPVVFGNQYQRTVLPGGEMQFGIDAVFQNTSSRTDARHEETPEPAANTQDEGQNIIHEGNFLSNLLRQVMPIISQNIARESDTSHAEAANVSDARNREASSEQAQEHSTTVTSSRRRASPPPPPNSKRHKRE